MTRMGRPPGPALDAPLPAQNPEFRQWRLRMGLSQPAAAEALGYGVKMICLHDRGERPVERTLQLAMEALEMRPGVDTEWRDKALAVIHRLINNISADQLVTFPIDLRQSRDLTPLAHDIAVLEGWDLFETDEAGSRLEIQRDDEANIFSDDLAALEYVKNKAEVGSTLHAIALELHTSKETTL